MEAILGRFALDLIRAIRAWQAAPFLPAFSVCVALTGQLELLVQQTFTLSPVLDSLLGLASIPVLLFTVGSFGTERVWYLRIFRAEAMQPRLIWSLSWRFLGRFVRLGLVVSWPLVVWVFGAMLVSRSVQPSTWPAWFHLGLYVLVIATDFALTFATPALTYTTTSAVQAFRIGLRMIRESWPDSAVYVLLPPLAVLLVARFNSQQFNTAIALSSTVATTLLNLLMKGATAAFYLQRREGRLLDRNMAITVPG